MDHSLWHMGLPSHIPVRMHHTDAQMHVHHLTGEQLISSTVWKHRGRHRHSEVTVLPLSASFFDFVHLICLFNNGLLIKKKPCITGTTKRRDCFYTPTTHLQK